MKTISQVLLVCVCLFVFNPSEAQYTKPTTAKLVTQAVPDTFRAAFITTKGRFMLEAYKAWAPKGVSRLYELIKTGYFNNTVIFRVQPDYVVQFGISNDTALYRFWDTSPIPDEALLQPNKKGMVSFASGGANTRTCQLFINKDDNYKLDTIHVKGALGYPPVARIISGWEVVDNFFSGNGRAPLTHQDSAAMYGNAYWERKFPGLDKIISATIVE